MNLLKEYVIKLYDINRLFIIQQMTLKKSSVDFLFPIKLGKAFV